MKEFNSKEEMIEYLNKNCNAFNFFTFNYSIIKIDDKFEYYEVKYLSENNALIETEIVKKVEYLKKVNVQK